MNAGRRDTRGSRARGRSRPGACRTRSTCSTGIAWSSPPNSPSTGRLMSRCALERPGGAEALARQDSVEADHAASSSASSAAARNDRKPPRQNPTLTTGRHRCARAARRSRLRRRRAPAGPELLDVRHVLEVLAARPQPRGAAEVVDRDRVMAGLREALGKLGVERIQPADVGQDHDPGARAPRGLRERRREARAVGRGQLEQLGPGASGDRRGQQVGWGRRRARIE